MLHCLDLPDFALCSEECVIAGSTILLVVKILLLNFYTVGRALG
jgi:hypothetical protein